MMVHDGKRYQVTLVISPHKALTEFWIGPKSFSPTFLAALGLAIHCDSRQKEEFCIKGTWSIGLVCDGSTSALAHAES